MDQNQSLEEFVVKYGKERFENLTCTCYAMEKLMDYRCPIYKPDENDNIPIEYYGFIADIKIEDLHGYEDMPSHTHQNFEILIHCLESKLHVFMCLFTYNWHLMEIVRDNESRDVKRTFIMMQPEAATHHSIGKDILFSLRFNTRFIADMPCDIMYTFC